MKSLFIGLALLACATSAQAAEKWTCSHSAMIDPMSGVVPAPDKPKFLATDRNDLDDQLFGTFARCRDLLRQPPVQAADRTDLRAKLSVASGGVVFTTIQKFLPEEKGDRHPILSERRNIVVIADEAHRSQYDFIDGFARHMRDALPNASFIGFTGTPNSNTHGRRTGAWMTSANAWSRWFDYRRPCSPASHRIGIQRRSIAIGGSLSTGGVELRPTLDTVFTRGRRCSQSP